MFKVNLRKSPSARIRVYLVGPIDSRTYLCEQHILDRVLLKTRDHRCRSTMFRERTRRPGFGCWDDFTGMVFAGNFDLV